VLGANANGEINPQSINLTEEEFWLNNEYALIEEIGHFLKKNNKYRTIVFGGNNPIFIPGHTDEKLYDEMYVNNNLDSLD